MRPHKKILSFFLGLFAAFLVVSPLLAAEGMQVRMRVDGMI